MPSRLVSYSVLLDVGAAVVLIAGGLGFLVQIDAAMRREDVKAEAAIVFSGEPGRVMHGIHLLRVGQAGRLFLAGNDNGGEELRQQRLHPDLFACCIEASPDTHNTRDDAAVAARWMRQRGVRSAIVVTSVTHVPRAVHELATRLPEVRLAVSATSDGRNGDLLPTIDPATWRVLAVEAGKYAAARLRSWGRALRLLPPHAAPATTRDRMDRD